MSDLQTLRPGLLVSLRTSIRGNVNYYKAELEGAHVGENGEQRSRWETTKVVFDPAEQEAVRSQAGSLIRGVCAQSAFGLLCPEGKAEELEQRIAQARALADDFNRGAELARVSVHVISGRIAQDDVAAVRAISAELRDLMRDMQEGLENLDVKAVRKACDKAVSVGQMLSPEAKGRTEVAIEAARKACRRIVKAGVAIGAEIDRAAIAKIEMSRTSFLDLDDDDTADDVAAPQAEARAVDFDGLGDGPLFPDGNRPEGWDEITQSAPGLGARELEVFDDAM